MTRKIIVILALLLLASCWEMDFPEEVPCDTPHCQQCDEETNTTCVQCDEQYYLDDINSLCSPCSDALPHCALCNYNGTAVQCTSCYPNYYLNNPEECKACDESILGCNTCHMEQSSPSTVLRRQLLEGKVRCDTCTNQTEFPTEDGSECKACNELIEHCSKCIRGVGNELQCQTCDEGYQWSQDNKKCEEPSSSTVVVILAVVGGVVVIGAGIVIWRMCQKKHKVSTLLDDKDNDY